jgi:hypothetical protein
VVRMSFGPCAHEGCPCTLYELDYNNAHVCATCGHGYEEHR